MSIRVKQCQTKGKKLTDRRNRIAVLAAERGKTISELAEIVNVKPHTLRRYARHDSEPRLEMAQQIADKLQISLESVLGTDIVEPVTTPVVAPSNNQMPIYGAAQGGPGFDITDIQTPADSAPVPPYLAGAANPYGVYVVGDSMEPRFYAGETLMVHPGKPVRKGDWVVVQFEDDGLYAVVKKFDHSNDKDVHLEQLNPPKPIRYERDSVRAVHKIVGAQFP